MIHNALVSLTVVATFKALHHKQTLLQRQNLYHEWQWQPTFQIHVVTDEANVLKPEIK